MYGGSSPGVPNDAPRGYERTPKFTPEMMKLFNQMFGHVGKDSYLSRLASGDQSMFEEMEAPAMRQFAGLQGDLASRFSGMGMGARRSSGFQNTANQATADFAQGLQSRRMDLRSQAIRDLMGLSNNLLGNNPYGLQEKEQPFWQKVVGGALPIAGSAVGAYFGGPAGAQIGSEVGQAGSKAFFGR